MRRTVRFALVFAACLAAAPLASAEESHPETELLGDGSTVIPLKNAAMIDMTEWGYRYRAGQQNSNLTVTEVESELRFIDTGTRELRGLPSTCRRLSADVGIAAACAMPEEYDETNPMFLQVWPRLGDDRVDGRTLPARYRLWTLADAGGDTVLGGAGDDFVNGAQDDDRVWGGPGNDWIRTGIGNDLISGGAGDDKLVGTDGADTIRGNGGNDAVYGGAGSDDLWGHAGIDTVNCGGGADDAWVDSADKARYCERLTTS